MGKYYTRSACFRYSKIWFNNVQKFKNLTVTVFSFVPPLNFSSVETEVIDAEFPNFSVKM